MFLIYQGSCLMKCCMDHNLPKECISEEIGNVQMNRLNKTHRDVKIVQTNECAKYTSTLSDCKSECIGKTKGNYKLAIRSF